MRHIGKLRSYSESGIFGHDFLDPDMVGVVTDIELKQIEKEIITIMVKYNLTAIDREFAGRLVTEELFTEIMHET